MLKTRKDSDSHPPPPNPGAYRFAPDPVQKSESEKRKEKKGKKIEGQMLSFARDESWHMNFVALLPVINYNAEIAFKRSLLCRHTVTHEFQPMAKA